MPARSATYRRRGPDGPAALNKLLDGVASAVNRGVRSGRAPVVAAAAAVPLAVGLIAARKKIGMHPALTLPLGCVPPLGLAIAVPKGRKRYLAVAAGYMHLFKLGWELPYDESEKLRKRLWIDEPIRFDTIVGLGVPPGLRLQRALRTPGEVTRARQGRHRRLRLVVRAAPAVRLPRSPAIPSTRRGRAGGCRPPTT